MKLCPKCAYVFTCRYANTDVTNCDKYEHTRLSREEYERQIDLKKQVKDSVDLKELEKFGFNKKGDDYKYYDNNTDEYIGVQQENGYIYVENYNPGLVGAIVEEKALDKLYDLIQAGLVEKVSED